VQILAWAEKTENHAALKNDRGGASNLAVFEDLHMQLRRTCCRKAPGVERMCVGDLAYNKLQSLHHTHHFPA
jgi:hypothetical protein